MGVCEFERRVHVRVRLVLSIRSEDLFGSVNGHYCLSVSARVCLFRAGL